MKTLNLLRITLLILLLPVASVTLTANDSLQPPAYLVANVQDNNIELSWGESGTQGDWLKYDNGIPAGSIGVPQPGVFRIASRWPAESLLDYLNKPVTKLTFIPNGFLTNYTLKIWSGQNAANLVYSQPLHGLQIGQWNEVSLSEPVLIEPETEYWFGIEFAQSADFEYPAVFDSGPATAGFGDMVNLGGNWISIKNTYNFDHNWILRVFVLSDELPEMLAGTAVPELPLGSDNNKLILNSGFGSGGSMMPEATTADLIGFNLYRDSVLLNEAPLNEATFTDENLPNGTYVYAVTAVYDVGESAAVEKTVQIGGPELQLDPSSIVATLQGGEILNVDVTLLNIGLEELVWEIEDLPSWISLNLQSGVLPAGGVVVAQLTINTQGLLNGQHNHVLVFNTNNMNSPQSFLLINIFIDGQMLLVSNPAILNFGLQPVNQSVLSSIELTNLSDALLMILSSQTGTGNFTAYMPTWAIPTGESIVVPVSFIADETGILRDTLYLEHFGYWGSDVLKVPLQGEGIVMPPSSLTASLEDNIVTLNWLPPGASSDVLRFGSGEPFASIGTSNGTYEVAARFRPVDLMPYIGKQLDQVGFYIGGTNAEFTLKIYTGEFAEVTLISLPVNNTVANEWNDIALPLPLPLDEVDYLWIGYEMVLTGLEFIAGVDGGPAVAGSGDLLRINGGEWTTLSDYNFSNNWNIRGLLSDADGTESLSLQAGAGITFKSGPEETGLLGYNVYRNEELLTSEPIEELSFTDVLEEGETWEYGVTAVFNFGESEPATITVGLPVTLTMPAGWGFTPTAMVHNIHLPEAMQLIGMSLSPGDMIGVFYDDNGVEKCAGAIQWTGNHSILKAFGNDPATPVKDGFDFNESLKWKVYMQQTGATANIVATYDHNMPHYDGVFKMLGLSMLESLELGTVGIDDVFAQTSEINIYPNPSGGQVTLSGISAGDQVNVYDNSGRLILSMISERPDMQLNISSRGLYLVEIRGQQEVERKKLIIR